jgi:hypothetical protein
MSSKIEKLFEDEVKKLTDAKLEIRRAEVEAEIAGNIAAVVQARLDDLRPETEAAVRAELAEKLLGKKVIPKNTVEVAPGPLTPQAVQKMLATLDPITLARGITRAKHGWMCIFCEMQFNTQRAASIHARSCDKRAAVLNGTAQPAEAATKRQKSMVNRKGKAKARTCIKPGCKKKSKGPRHHHLCEDHLKAPKKKWQAWQKKDREARAA